MENTSLLIQDAIKIGTAIINSVTPYNKWVIVNIAKTPNLAFNFPTIPSIPTCFGYNYDRVPEIFEDEWVIEAKVGKRWFTQLTKLPYSTYSPPVHEINDFITQTARTKNYIDKDTRASYFKGEQNYYGQELSGQFVVLINIEQLRRFIGFHTGSVPLYYPGNKCLFYRGNKITIEGEVESKLVDILIKNYNSIVPKDAIYRHVYPTGKEYTKNKVHGDDSIKSTYKRIEAKLNKDTFFGQNFVFTQKKGYGIFVVQPYKEDSATLEIK